MITTGIVKEVNLNSNGYLGNTFMVEVPIFNSAADKADYKTILEATACLPGGIYDCYHIGDAVYVGFINNKYSFPFLTFHFSTFPGRQIRPFSIAIL